MSHVRNFRIRQFGNPILRSVSRRLSQADIQKQSFQKLITDMHAALRHKAYGVGLAAPQVGYPLALAVVGMKPTPTRPDTPKLILTLINPVIISLGGKRQPAWEGCLSGPALYAQALRYPKLRLRYTDQKGKIHVRNFEGLAAQVIQHEVDHLNGSLFVDRVKDPTTYMTVSEYRKRKRAEKQSANKDRATSGSARVRRLPR